MEFLQKSFLLFLISSFLIISSDVIAQKKSDTVSLDNKKVVVQNPPVNVEALVGSRGVVAQVIVLKKFQSLPKLGVFNVSSVVGEWKTHQVNDYMIQSMFTYVIIKNLDVIAGFHLDPIFGIKPTVGLLYIKGGKDYTFIATPRIDLTTEHSVEGLVIGEYTPKINDDLKFYSKIQALYNRISKGDLHGRSYIDLRAGLSYKEFNFGVGTNFDWYGPDKIYDSNVGVFLQMNLY